MDANRSLCFIVGDSMKAADDAIMAADCYAEENRVGFVQNVIIELQEWCKKEKHRQAITKPKDEE